MLKQNTEMTVQKKSPQKMSEPKNQLKKCKLGVRRVFGYINRKPTVDQISKTNDVNP